MAKFTHNISSILSGLAPSYYFAQEGSYHASVAVDPDEVFSNTSMIGAVINPVTYGTFENMEGAPLWQIPNPKTTNTLVYTGAGNIYSYDKELEMREEDENSVAFPFELSGASGNGLEYYNDFYYIAKDDDIDRYGPLSGTPVLVSDYWTEEAKTRSEIFTILTSQNSISLGNIASSVQHTDIAQKIIPTQTINFNKVVLAMSASGPDLTTATITVSICADDEDEPGSSIANATLACTGISSSLVEYDFNINLQLTADIPYWVKVSIDIGNVGANGIVSVRYAVNSNPYPDGRMMESTNSGSTWANTGANTALSLMLIQETQIGTELNTQAYPTIGEVAIPNHALHRHVDNSLYIPDFQSGRGVLHRLQTNGLLEVDNLDVFKYGTSGAGNAANGFVVGEVVRGETSKAQGIVSSVENAISGTSTALSTRLVLSNIVGTFEDNETIVGSTSRQSGDVDGTLQEGHGIFNVATAALAIERGYYPVSVESYGQDIAVLANITDDSETNQGNAKLFLWDTFNESWYLDVELPFVIGTALKNVNGVLHFWGGNGTNGYYHGRYAGGQTILPENVRYFSDGLPPLQGAVDTDMARLAWGSTQEYPTEGGSVVAYGSKSAALSAGYHNIARANGSQVTSLHYATQVNKVRELIIGWASEESEAVAGGMDKRDDDGEQVSVFRGPVERVGEPFQVKKVLIPFGEAIEDGVEVAASIWVDGASKEYPLRLVAFTSYPDKRFVYLASEANGNTDYFVELSFTGTKKIPVALPIQVQGETTSPA